MISFNEEEGSATEDEIHNTKSDSELVVFVFKGQICVRRVGAVVDQDASGEKGCAQEGKDVDSCMKRQTSAQNRSS